MAKTKDAEESKKPVNENSGSNDTAPHIPENLLDNTSQTFTSQLEWEADRRSVTDAKHDAMDKFLKNSIVQRVELLRDTLAVAVTILLGASTLYITSSPDHSIIKSKYLFFISLLVLIGGIVANLVARSEIVKHLQDVSFQIEKNYIDIYTSSRDYLANPSTTRLDTVWRAESAIIPFPMLKKRGEKGHIIAIWTIIAGILGTGLSLVIVIHT